MVIDNEKSIAWDQPDDEKPHGEAPVTRTDYNGMSIDEWKGAIGRDVNDRFGPVPDDLIPVGKPGW